MEQDHQIGVRIAGLREGLGMSQRELARRAGLSTGAITLIERGLREPKTATLRKLAPVLCISIGDLIGAAA